ncbi:MAG: SufD family Fe-S cluster assembly protein, partial [Dokdonella sp.]
MSAGFLERMLAEAPQTSVGDADWLAAARTNALEQLARDGMPGTRSESWKYSSLRALAQRSYQLGDAEAGSRSIDANLLALPGVDGPRLVFVNGAFRGDLSSLASIKGLRFDALSNVLESDPGSLQPFLSRSFDDAAQVFSRLNTALANDGAVIRVEAGVTIEPLLHIVLVGASASTAFAWQLRNIIDVGDGASLRVVEHHVGQAPQDHFGNVLNQIALRENARLDLLQVQNAAESVSLIRRTDVTLDTAAHLELRSIEAGALWMRHDLAVQLIGDHSRFVSRGVFALRGRQHA